MLLTALSVNAQVTVESPDKTNSCTLETVDGHPTLKIVRNGAPAIDSVDLGLRINGVAYNSEITMLESTEPVVIHEDYTMIHGKKNASINDANSVTTTLKASDGLEIDIEMRAYNNGVCFRYLIDNEAQKQLSFSDEYTAYHINSNDKRWLQQFVASYEGDFPLQNGSEKQAAWNYPMLFQSSDDSWMLITEAGSNREYSNTHVSNEDNKDVYKLCMPYSWEGNNTGSSIAVSKAKEWKSPWRVVVLGSLGDIVESTMVQDVSEPSVLQSSDWVLPGRSAWVYWAYNHGTKDYKICCEYVDLAEKMGWEYVLFDWEWDSMSNGGKLEDAVSYAVSKGIKPLLWYNSGGPHTTVGSTPRDRMLTHESRVKEFQWLKSIGVVGVKIDFFESDKQNIVQYYLDILDDAVAEKMMVIFHGCTLPRGWERTYPNLMTYEAVYGAEQYNNTSNMTAIAARLNCTLPYTRNVVGPMDYTPVAFSNSQNPHNTSYAHELALSVAFESGIQNWADKTEGFDLIEGEARRHMQSVPAAWDETHFVSGYPGESFVVARRKGAVWYVAGLNGKSEKNTLTVNLDFLGDGTFSAIVLTDGRSSKKITTEYRDVKKSDILNIDCLSQGGFVIKIYPSLYNALTELKVEANNALTLANNNTGEAAGQYSSAYIEKLEQALKAASTVTETSDEVDIEKAYDTLMAAYTDFMSNGINIDRTPEGMDNAQNITAKYLLEARNFSRSDKALGASTRFGILAEPWVTTAGLINQDNYTHGGYDSFEGSNSISVEKWDAGGAAIVNGKIYQTSKKKLNPGKYHLWFNLYSNMGFGEGENFLVVAKGNDLPDKDNLGSALASYDMSWTGYNGEYTCCEFELAESSEITFGWLVNMAEELSGRSMRINDIRLYSGDQDVSSEYIANYTNIQRKDVSPARFGSPANWTVENFNIDNGSNGVKLGIDKYNGDNALYLGVWDDEKNAVGDLHKTGIYRKISLPAGKYFFGAAYHSTWNIKNAHLYVATRPLVASETQSEAIAYHFIPGTSEDNTLHGVDFQLDSPAEIVLGWNADLSQSNEQEIRIKEIGLMRYLDEKNEWETSMAFQANEIVAANAFAHAGGASNSFSVDNVPLLYARDGALMCIGHVNLSDIHAVSLTCNSMLQAPEDALYEVYLDNEPTPWMSLPVAETASVLPETKVADVESHIEGVHTVYLKCNGYNSNIWNMTFLGNDSPTGITLPNVSQQAAEYFDLFGRKLPYAPDNGFYIIRDSNGTRKAAGKR